MDYDKWDIAATYDAARALTPARQRRWRDLLAAHADRRAVSMVVDLGCGTGRFSEILVTEFDARVIGFGRSANMIAQARRRPVTKMIEFVRASAGMLPLADGCADLVFMSQVYHHLPDPIAAARECRRVLRAGGSLCLRTAKRENDVVIPRFFPAVRAMLDADLPSGDDVSSNFGIAGFTAEHHAVITEIVAPDWPGFVRKSALRAASFLARLPDSEFNRGIAALRAHLADVDVHDDRADRLVRLHLAGLARPPASAGMADRTPTRRPKLRPIGSEIGRLVRGFLPAEKLGHHFEC